MRQSLENISTLISGLIYLLLKVGNHFNSFNILTVNGNISFLYKYKNQKDNNTVIENLSESSRNIKINSLQYKKYSFFIKF